MKIIETTYSDGSTALATEGITIEVSGIKAVSHAVSHVNDRDVDAHIARHLKKPHPPKGNA